MQPGKPQLQTQKLADGLLVEEKIKMNLSKTLRKGVEKKGGNKNFCVIFHYRAFTDRQGNSGVADVPDELKSAGFTADL